MLTCVALQACRALQGGYSAAAATYDEWLCHGPGPLCLVLLVAWQLGQVVCQLPQVVLHALQR